MMNANYPFDSDAPSWTRKQRNWSVASTTQQGFICLQTQHT